MKRTLFHAACLSTIALSTQSHAQTLITQRTIALDAALQAASAALETCRKSGYQVTVTVIDRSGHTLAVLHDDGASPHTIENSFRKTYTALTFRMPSGEMGKRIAANPTATSPLLLANVTSAEGALPIRAGDDLVGAIGVSGAPGGGKDAICAQGGIDRISAGLK